MKWLLTICTSTWLVSCAQTFNLRQRFEREAALHTSMVVKGNYVYCNGASLDSVNPLTTETYLIQYDLDGQTVRRSFFNVPERRQTATGNNALFENNHGELVTTGYTMDSSYVMRCLLIVFDTTGLVKWYKEYSSPSLFLCGRKVLQSPDGSYYIAGDIQHTNHNSNIFLLKTDSAGNQQWLNSYGVYNKVDVVSTLIYTTSNELICSFSRHEHPNQLPLVYFQNWMMKWDTNGSVLDSVLYNVPEIGGAWSLVKTNDDKYAFCGGKVTEKDLGGVEGIGYIAKTDTAFFRIWDFSIGASSYFTSLREFKQLADSSYVAVGFHLQDTNDDSYHGNGWMVKVSADGDSVWQRFYRGVTRICSTAEDNYLYDLEVLNDGSLLACGKAQDYCDTFPQQAWLLRLDANGCTDSGWCGYGPVDVGIELLREELLVWRVFPNPMQNELQVQLPDNKGWQLRLTDAKGAVVFSSKVFSNHIQLPTGHYPSGIYFISIENDEGIKLTKRVVKP